MISSLSASRHHPCGRGTSTPLRLFSTAGTRPRRTACSSPATHRPEAGKFHRCLEMLLEYHASPPRIERNARIRPAWRSRRWKRISRWVGVGRAVARRVGVRTPPVYDWRRHKCGNRVMRFSLQARFWNRRAATNALGALSAADAPEYLPSSCNGGIEEGVSAVACYPSNGNPSA